MDLPYALTSTQQAIWITQRVHPQAVLYNVGGYACIHGKLDPELLERSIRHVIQQHDAFRLRFREDGTKPQQYMDVSFPVTLQFVDFSSGGQSDEQCLQYMKENFDKNFSPEAPLFETVLLKSASCYYWYVKLHHLIADGLSLALLFNTTGEIYTQLYSKAALPPVSSGSSYALFLEKNKHYRESSSFMADKVYWLERFKDIPEKPDLGIVVKSGESAPSMRAERVIHKASYEKIRACLEKNNISIYHFVLSALYIFFSKLFRKDKFVVGLPVFNRPDRSSKQTFGTCINVLPFKFDDYRELSCAEMLSRIRSQLFSDYKHQRFSAFDLRESLDYRGNLFNIVFSYQKIHYKNKFHEADATIHYMKSREMVEDVVVHLIAHNHEWDTRLVLDYKKDLLPPGVMEGWMDALLYLLDTLPGKEAEKVKHIDIVPEEQVQLLQGFNATKSNYPAGKTIVDLFREQAAAHPLHTAIQEEEYSISYQELDALTSRFAAWIQEQGMKQGAIIGLVSGCSARFVIAALSILKAGAAYLPIDPQTPKDRIRYMADDSQLSLLLIEDKCAELLREPQPLFAGKVQVLSGHFLASLKNRTPAAGTDPHGLAYVIYTSGTTGKPKGVMIKHQSLVNYTWYAARRYVKGEPLHFPLFTSVSFDLTITSIYTPLVTGNSIVAYSGTSSELVLERIMEEKKVGIVKLTPSHLKLIRHKKFEHTSVKRLIVGGEELEVALARDITENLGGDVEIFNEYGPTETTVGCIVHLFRPWQDNGKFVPIGRPIDNTKGYILDEHLHLLPIGATGELFISGDSVGAGYLNNAPVTRKKFLKDPFSGKKSIMYRTGDQARWLPGGEMEFLGRIDEQVQVKGFRVEPREIESTLLAHPDIKAARVVCKDIHGEKCLCAYLVARRPFEPSELRTYLSHSLHHYMIPAYFILLDKMPLTTNGKIDKDQLPSPLPPSSRHMVSPRNFLELKTLEAWSDVLKTGPLGITDNYYDLGGDSIKAIQIISRLNPLGVRLSVKDILTFQTVEALSANGKLESNCLTYSQHLMEGEKPLSPVEKWFFAHRFKNPHHYNQSVLLEFKTGIAAADLQQAIHKILEHHDALRLNYHRKKNVLFYNNSHLLQPFSLPVHDLSELDEKSKADALQQIGTRIKAGFDICKGLLIRGTLIRWDKNTMRVLVSMHHLLTDGISWRIFLEDLYTACQALKNKRDVVLPPKTASLAHFNQKLHEQFDGEKCAAEKKYWKEAEATAFTLPVDFHTDDWSTTNRKKLKCVISEEATAILRREMARRHKSELSVALLTALAGAIHQWTRMQTMVVEMEHHGRYLDDVDVSRTMGWFTSIYPLKLDTCPGAVREQIAAVTEALKNIPAYGRGYGVLRFIHDEEEIRDIRAELRFNYLGEFERETDNDLFRIVDEASGEECAPENEASSKLELNGMLVNEKLIVELSYNKNMYRAETMEKLMESLHHGLMEIKDHLLRKEQVHFTPSDFDTVDIKHGDLEKIFN